MNAPLQFGVVMLGGNILLFIGQGNLRIPSLAVGILSVLLTSVRTVWLGFMVALITLLVSLKGGGQIRLIAFILMIFVFIVPLSSVEPFSKVIQSRVSSLSNVQDDQSAKDRANLYGLVLNEALSEVIGKGNGTLGPIDSGIIELLLTLGWMGSIPYISGILLSFYTLFQASKSKADPFASAARAIVVGFLPMVAGSNVIAGISGMIFWGFMGVGMAAIKYNKHQRPA
jgi:hypothetical protein